MTSRQLRAWLRRLYGDWHYGRWLRLRHFRRMLRELPVDWSNAQILDAGCGEGAAAIELAGAFPGATVLGIDTDASAIAALRARVRNHPNLSFEVSSIPELAFDREFDFVYCVAVLEYIAHPERAVERLGAALRPGGFLLLDVIEPDLGFSSTFGLRKYMKSHQIPEGMVRQGYSLADVTSLLYGAGLEPSGYRYTMGPAALFAHTVFEFLREDHLRLYFVLLPLLRIAGYVDLLRPQRRGASLMVWARR